MSIELAKTILNYVTQNPRQTIYSSEQIHDAIRVLSCGWAKV